MAMFEKDGQPAEKLLRNILRSQWFYPRARPYKTDNFYQTIEKEGRMLARQEQEAAPAGKTAAKKHTASKGK